MRELRLGVRPHLHHRTRSRQSSCRDRFNRGNPVFAGQSRRRGADFEAVLAGARERLPDDDALLTEIGGVLDSLYAHFGREGARAKA